VETCPGELLSKNIARVVAIEVWQRENLCGALVNLQGGFQFFYAKGNPENLGILNIFGYFPKKRPESI